MKFSDLSPCGERERRRTEWYRAAMRRSPRPTRNSLSRLVGAVRWSSPPRRDDNGWRHGTSENRLIRLTLHSGARARPSTSRRRRPPEKSPGSTTEAANITVMRSYRHVADGTVNNPRRSGTTARISSRYFPCGSGRSRIHRHGRNGSFRLDLNIISHDRPESLASSCHTEYRTHHLACPIEHIRRSLAH